MKEFFSLYFFPDTYVSLLIFDQSFQKPKGGPFGEKKNLKKLDFDVCDAIKVHFVIILFITQVPSVKLLKLVFSRRLMRDDGKCNLCFVLHGY